MSTGATGSQEQSGATTSQTPPANTGQTPIKTKKRFHKKKPGAAGCNSSSTSGNSGTSAPTGSGSPAGVTAKDPASTNPPGTTAASKNCPPDKVIVRQGGTAEPAIQLAGGPGGDQASQKRDAAKRMLGSTEANLKKIAGLQLTADQQDTVSQIRRFVDQSKEALAAGDLERGQTLAWKAQLLSEDLVNPPK